jgi:hypothetical protein
LANDEAKPNTEKGPKEVAAVQNRVPREKVGNKTEAKTSPQQSPNQTVWFPKPDHLVSLGSGQRKASRTTMPKMAPAPHWCPPRLTPSQRRRIQ